MQRKPVLAILLTLIAVNTTTAVAQSYPQRPVRLVVAVAAGARQHVIHGNGLVRPLLEVLPHREAESFGDLRHAARRTSTRAAPPPPDPALHRRWWRQTRRRSSSRSSRRSLSVRTAPAVR